MPTEMSGGQSENEARPTLSPEFFSAGTEAGLEKIRTRLLDLTNRNKLLNFRHSTASTIRIVNVDPDAVFRRLVDGQTLPFLPVPEPDPESIDLADENDTSKKIAANDHAKEVGWEVNYDLDGAPSDPDLECLPVLHYLDRLDTLTRKINGAARTAIEESGTNMLYLVFGLLQWFESDDSQEP